MHSNQPGFYATTCQLFFGAIIYEPKPHVNMSSRLTLRDDYSSLKKKLLSAFIVLALLATALFSFLGAGLLSKVREAVERETFDGYLNGLEVAIVGSSASNSHALSSVSNLILPVKDRLLALSVDGTWVYAATATDFSGPLQEIRDTAPPSGFFTVAGDGYFVNQLSSNNNNQGIRAIWKTDEATATGNYLLAQLSVTALVPLIFTVWGAIVLSSAVSRRFEKANRALHTLALVDGLTQLPNRNALLNSLELDCVHGTLFFIDLDRFKDINDALGHDTGDRLLIAFAQRLQTLSCDNVKVYRHRSDEFVVWQSDLEPEDVQSQAFSVLYKCREPLKIGDSFFEIGCSIGVACYPEHGNSLKTLLQNAENAMCRAKRLRLGVQVYNEYLAHNQALKVALRSQLHSALQQRQFELYYQPKVMMDTGKLVGVEAIVRWHHPDEGVLAPGLFIDLVEQSGIVHAFTRYIVEAAVKQIGAWQESGHNVSVSVNLSAYNLLDDSFIPFVQSLLERAGVSPSLLEFELTESATMVDINTSKQMISAFRKMGVNTSIDDFGTGMSSFAYLRELDIHTVKLDRSFVKHIHLRQKDARIVEGIVSMCRGLSIGIVAEGVENTQQADVLRKLDCQVGQGFLFSKAVPSSLLQTFLPDVKQRVAQPLMT